MNMSFRDAVFPEKLKCGVVSAIHKGKSKTSSCNYWPISTLPILSKILEKLTQSSIPYKFDKLYKHQFGFQKGKSTEHAILDLQTKIIKSLEKHEKACSIFLDFAKAFDIVNDDILLSKLEYYGVKDIPLKSYLQNRQQCIKINSNISDFQTLLRGVPQGSVLGPSLFHIYINDIFLSAPKVSFHLFVDDTCILLKQKSKTT